MKTVTTSLYKPFLLGPAATKRKDWVQSIPPFSIRRPDNPIKILILYGSLRKRSISRLLAFEFGRVLEHMGADVCVYSPDDLPLKNGNKLHPKVVELRELSTWSDGQVWVSPEQHGQISGVFKTQLDWIPLSYKDSEGDEVKPTQGKTLAVAQVHGGAEGFNAVDSLRLLSRWIKMYTVSNQVCISKAWNEFDDQDRMKPSFYRTRMVDVAEELYKLTTLLRPQKNYLLDRYSEREKKVEKKVKDDEFSVRQTQNKYDEVTDINSTFAMLEQHMSSKRRDEIS
ncbi:flavoprotein-like protein [Circinella umbellata]|nr:flavoprotein-like protein [Circinella umbellata]